MHRAKGVRTAFGAAGCGGRVLPVRIVVEAVLVVGRERPDVGERGLRVRAGGL